MARFLFRAAITTAEVVSDAEICTPAQDPRSIRTARLGAHLVRLAVCLQQAVSAVVRTFPQANAGGTLLNPRTLIQVKWQRHLFCWRGSPSHARSWQGRGRRRRGGRGLGAMLQPGSPPPASKPCPCGTSGCGGAQVRANIPQGYFGSLYISTASALVCQRSCFPLA